MLHCILLVRNEKLVTGQIQTTAQFFGFERSMALFITRPSVASKIEIRFKKVDLLFYFHFG